MAAVGSSETIVSTSTLEGWTIEAGAFSAIAAGLDVVDRVSTLSTRDVVRTEVGPTRYKNRQVRKYK
jgi:hypothetical protein